MISEPAPLTVAAIGLMKGVVYRDTAEPTWRHVVALQAQLRDHMDVIGLDVIVDEAEGYAYLRAKPEDPDAPIPRLVPRHRLSHQTSLLLVLLRKALAEFDATDGQGRLVVTRDDLVEQLRTFLPDSTNEARLVDQVDTAIKRVAELGYLKQQRGSSTEWEVRRVIKAFVDAEWLGRLDDLLREYAAVGSGAVRRTGGEHGASAARRRLDAAESSEAGVSAAEEAVVGGAAVRRTEDQIQQERD